MERISGRRRFWPAKSSSLVHEPQPRSACTRSFGAAVSHGRRCRPAINHVKVQGRCASWCSGRRGGRGEQEDACWWRWWCRRRGCAAAGRNNAWAVAGTTRIVSGYFNAGEAAGAVVMEMAVVVLLLAGLSGWLAVAAHARSLACCLRLPASAGTRDPQRHLASI
jgi:hypothetical protein